LVNTVEGDMLSAVADAAGATQGCRVLVVDTYRVDSTWLKRARERFPGVVVVVDDLADRYLHADIVVNQNVGAESLDVRADHGTTLLLGLRYALLRPDISAARDAALMAAPRTPPRRVLVVMGGSDPTGSAPGVANACARALPEADILVVAPAGSVAEGPRVRSVARIASMATEMMGVDLVVTAAGSTLWEAFCLARPVAALLVAANQTDVYRRLVADGVVLGLGGSPVVPDEVASVLTRELMAEGVLLRFAEAGARMVDGLGAQRVASEIERATERWSNARG
jgi:UDP-2,4-diacetamido-2,4,6-trideoxy-beta-L-altropyranose hydrolase